MKPKNNQKSIDLGLNWRRRRKTAQPLTDCEIEATMRLYYNADWEQRRRLIEKLYIHGAVVQLRAIAKSDGHPLCRAEAKDKLRDLAAAGMFDLDKKTNNAII